METKPDTSEQTKSEKIIKEESSEIEEIDQEQARHDNGNLVYGPVETDELIRSVDEDLALLTAQPLLFGGGESERQRFLPCTGCNHAIESKLRLEKHLETILESLRFAQLENLNTKAILKQTETELMEKDDEISSLKKELLNVNTSNANKNSAGNKVSSSSAEVIMGSSPPVSSSNTQQQQNHYYKRSPPTPMATTNHHNAFNGNRDTNNFGPVNLTSQSSQQQQQKQFTVEHHQQQQYPNYPNYGQTLYSTQTSGSSNNRNSANNKQIMHGIDGGRINCGYFCICGMQFSFEPLLYRHLRNSIRIPNITSSSSSTTTQSGIYSLSSSSSSQSSPSQILLVCSICHGEFEDWEAFKSHTKSHGIVDLEEFDFREANMARLQYHSSMMINMTPPNGSSNQIIRASGAGAGTGRGSGGTKRRVEVEPQNQGRESGMASSSIISSHHQQQQHQYLSSGGFSSTIPYYPHNNGRM